MSWDAARERAHGFRARKPYKAVAPIKPDVCLLAGETYWVNGHICHKDEVRGLTGPEAAELDGTCEGCGYKICSCEYTCAGCGERATRGHPDARCMLRLRQLLVEAYVARKVPIPEHVDPYFLTATLTDWAREAARNEYRGMTDEARLWAVRWRYTYANLPIDPPGFLASLRRYITLSLAGKSHDQIELQLMREKDELARAKLEVIQRELALLERVAGAPEAPREQERTYDFPVNPSPYRIAMQDRPMLPGSHT